MQTKYATDETQERLWEPPATDQGQGSKWMPAGVPDLWERIEEQVDSEDLGKRRNSYQDRLSLPQLVAAAPPGLALPKDKAITISVIKGPSKGLIYRLFEPHISIGRSGGGADIEIDDQQVSNLHCAVGVKQDIIRLCDLDSHTGTYVENQRVAAVPLEHLSEFRVGTSVLLVTVLPAQAVPVEGST